MPEYGGLNLVKTVSKALKTEIETAVKEQIDPLLNEKPLLEKWFSFVLSGQSTSRLVKKLYSGQPSELLKLIRSDPQVKRSKEKDTLFSAISYLLSVEIDGSLIIDLFILMMVAKGIEFHIEPDWHHSFIRHVISLDDLESASATLAAKLDFLSTCGLTCFPKYIDRELRNKIAHTDFLVSKEGKFITFKNDKKKEVDVKQKLEKLQYFISSVDKRLVEKTEEHLKNQGISEQPRS